MDLPAEQGDILAAIFDGFDQLLLVDGYFHGRFPCTTFEVMTAIEQGLRVFGAGSIGALRAAELDEYGMTGVGYVYETLRDYAIKPYHVVAQTYLPNNQALTPPLIQLIYFLERAEAEGTITATERQRCVEQLNDVHFMSLSVKDLFKSVPALEACWKQGDFDIKQQDARLLIDGFRALPRAPAYADIREQSVRRLFDKYAGSADMSLPADWRDGADSYLGRACAAEVTVGHARAFFDNLEVTVADTTRYDASGSHVLSTYLIPFYFLDYYPSAATGNGADFDEALASAYRSCWSVRLQVGNTFRNVHWLVGQHLNLPQRFYLRTQIGMSMTG